MSDHFSIARALPLSGLTQASLLLVAFVLSACGTSPRQETTPVVKAPASVPVPSSRSGGYYLDDGPGANPPANIDSIPDAVPRAEPLHRGALRPYTVMGRNYVPMTAVAPYRARGVASWYGRRYHGKLTSTGETYDMYGMSAAHPTLPLPSYVRVTSVANGKSVILRVNDRGPFIDSRLIDLSYTAAYKLGVIAGGSAMVEVEAIVPGVALAPAPAAVIAEPPPVKAAAPTPIPLSTDPGGVHLQLAAFGSRENAEAYAARLRGDFDWLAPQVQVAQRDNLFRVLAGPYASPAEARLTAEKITQTLGVKPVVLTK